VQKTQLLAVEAILGVLSGESLTARLNVVWGTHTTLTDSQRGHLQDLCFGTLRYLAELKAYAKIMAEKPIQDAQINALLWIALYQLLYTRNAAHTVVNEAVAAVEGLHRGWAKGLVNALLRRFERERSDLVLQVRSQEETRYSYPKWWIDRLRKDHPDCFAILLEEGNRHPPMTLRVNRRRLTQEAYLAELRAQHISATAIGDAGLLLDRPVPVARLPGFNRGWVSVQDYGAQLAPALLDLADGMRVCDACAAPGGKTAHLLESAKLAVTALDVDPSRLSRVSQTLDRLGLSARTLCADAANLLSWWDGSLFDRVLLDAPCSASGVVRRHPDSKWLRRDSDIAQFAQQQSRLLRTLWQVVTPGGKLLYVTCSLFSMENEAVISAFLAEQSDAVLAPPSPPLDAAGRLLPCASNDGFFYALLCKR